MAENPIEHLKSLIEKFTVITLIPDIDRYRRVPEGKKGRCIFRGCTEPIAWEDASGGNFLCEGHYRTMRKWISEARRGLVPGSHVSPIFQTQE